MLASFTPGLRENATLLRLVRLARVLRVVRLLPDLRVLTVAVGRSLPGVASLAVLAVTLVFVYGMVGWVMFAEENPAQYGDIGAAMLTLFVTLTLENFPDQIDAGREITAWAIPYFLSFVLIAAFLLLNMLIGVVISAMEEAREIDAQRQLDDRREHGEEPEPAPLADRVAALQTALAEIERELRVQRTPPGT